MTQKKILIFSLAYHPLIGGAEVAIREITNRIPDVRFDMVTMRFNKKLPIREKIGNVNIYRVGLKNKYKFIFSAYNLAKKLHEKNNYDAIWAMMANYAGFSALFFKLKFPNIKYILTLQEGDPISYIKKRVGIFGPIFKRVFTKADVIQVISKYLESFARNMGYSGRIEVIPNGVDVLEFSKHFDAYELENIKHDLNKKSFVNKNGETVEDVFLITTSRLVAKNATEDTIMALKYLPEYVKFIVLGVGQDINKLKNIVSNEGLSDRVIFLGFVDYFDIPKYLKISDIFIRPSVSEGFGISFIEAMATGIPVITTPVGGIVDFLFDPDVNPDKPPTGLFCRVHDPKNIAKKVIKILQNNDLRHTLIHNAKKMVEEKYDWNLVVEDMKKRVFSV